MSSVPLSNAQVLDGFVVALEVEKDPSKLDAPYGGKLTKYLVEDGKKVKKGDGFDGFGTPDPFNQNDDDEVDQGEPNAPEQENPDEAANMVSDEDAADDDDSFAQVDC